MSLATRTTLLTTAVAAVAVLIAGAISFGLVRSAAEAEARKNLQRQADVAVSLVGKQPGPPKKARVVVLRRQGIGISRVRPSGQIPDEVSPEERAAITEYKTELAAGQEVSAVTSVSGAAYLVEARPLEGGWSIVLVQRMDSSRALARSVILRTMLALAIGLAVAVVAALLLSRRLARPLRRAAGAAHTLATGSRDVRVPVEGPAEVAEVAAALNMLAGALQYSEGRQREFLLSVSHELRTPLTAVKGYAESLADGVVDGRDGPEVGRTMLAEAERLERLVRDLLDLARLGADDFRLDLAEVDLTELVCDAATVWRARCEAQGVLFASEVPAVPVPGWTDPTRFRQIIDALAENALRVTPAGRPIVFALGVLAGGDAVLQVRDGGPGLSDEDFAVAFQRGVLYERYKGVRRVGSGVGLALVHGLATKLGGNAAAGRAPEGGACFAIRVPRGHRNGTWGPR